ncbi:MAG: flagellar biosynthesis protein FlhF-like protein [Pseudomonadota bacterium]
MRMKSFSAPTLDAAKAAVFAELGNDAVILSERETDAGVEVRAATEKMGGSARGDTPFFLNRHAGDHNPAASEDPVRARVRDALSWHGAPATFARKVSDVCTAEIAGRRFSDPRLALTCGLDLLCRFDPLPIRPCRDVLLIGAPGHGRTSVAAKLTRRAALARRQLTPLAADFDDTAGKEQLAAFLPDEAGQIRVAKTPDALFSQFRAQRTSGRRCVIDLPAIVSTDPGDMARLSDLLTTVDAEPVLVVSAEGHAHELADAAGAFARAGVRRAIVTKLDVVRRRGPVVAALSGAGIVFSHLSATPFIGSGLVPAGPERLAALLTEDAPGQVLLKGAA